MFSAKRKAFTLIEMLIVIVIIGILAAALVPRMMSARDKAADVGIQADVQNLANGLISYAGDHTDLSALNGITLTTGLTLLVSGGYLTSLPKTAYTFGLIKRGTVTSGGFYIRATTKTIGAANYLSNFATIAGTSSSPIAVCTDVSIGATASTGVASDGKCNTTSSQSGEYVYSY